MIPKIELTDKPSQEARDAIVHGLMAFNEAAAPGILTRPLAVVLSHPETNAFLGGLWGRTHWDRLYIELLFVPEALRHGGWGTKIMDMAESEAVRRGCRGVWLDTFSFQARGFYERRRYAVFGTIEDYPPGHARFFLTKSLAVPA
jgi:GNAT superfamily N-acetyltransferase